MLRRKRKSVVVQSRRRAERNWSHERDENWEEGGSGAFDLGPLPHINVTHLKPHAWAEVSFREGSVWTPTASPVTGPPFTKVGIGHLGKWK